MTHPVEPERTRLMPAVPAALPPVPRSAPPSDASPVRPPDASPVRPPDAFPGQPPDATPVRPPPAAPAQPAAAAADPIPIYPPPVPPPRPLRSWQVEAPETLPGESLTTYVPAPADEREPASTGGSRLLRATGTMAVATAVSRVTGGLKAAVLSAAIGIGLVGDAYTTANYLPNIVYELLIGGILTSVVVPLLVRAQESDEDG
ncbi:MAG: murein biosynthesis integral membrane protein MurJ, partial [Actinomycetota bacterium]|nr:murein biosynthesis integral membrane protein MurJ [Actinomycetota bacterium]